MTKKDVFWQNLFLFSCLMAGSLGAWSAADWAAANFTGPLSGEAVRTAALLIAAGVLVPAGIFILDGTVRGWPSGTAPLWRVIWLIPVLTTIAQLLLGSVLVNPAIQMDYFYLFSRLLTLIASVMLCWVLANALRQSAEKIILEERSQLLESLNKTKTNFLEDIRHEVRTPLLVVSLGTDFIRECMAMGMTGEADKSLTDIQNEALRLGRMINGMVDLATMSGVTKNREQTDFAGLLTHCAETSRLELEQRHNTLRVEIAPDLPRVYAEAEQLARVPINLLTNANECTRNGEITVEATALNNCITVRIRDTGEGIAPELLPRVLERGVSGRGGKGYGLSMCKTIVEAHGGTIYIESEPGKGTTVTFTVPGYSGQSEARL